MGVDDVEWASAVHSEAAMWTWGRRVTLVVRSCVDGLGALEACRGWRRFVGMDDVEWASAVHR